MLSIVLPIDHDLSGRSRLRPASLSALRIEGAELPLLVLVGATAAALTALIDLKLRIPGHSIFRCIVPMSFGLAAAPRRRAGVVMGSSAVLTAVGLQITYAASMGVGAIMSLGLTGVLLDLAATRARRGKTLYAAFAAAGLVSNMVAFAVKGTTKYVGADAGARPFTEWISVAPVSYSVCGLLAGLAGAALFFQFAEISSTDRSRESNA